MGIFFHAVVAFFIETDLFYSKKPSTYCAASYILHIAVSHFILYYIFLQFHSAANFFLVLFFIFIIGKKEKRDTIEVYILTMYADHTIESSTKEDAQWAKIFFKEHCYFYMIFQKIFHESFTRK